MNKDNKNTAKKNGLFSTLKRWGRRMFFGASNEMAKDVLFVEKIESPSVMAVKSFFRRKLAVAALIVLISMFLFVFIGPVLMPVDINYTDPLQANLDPNYSNIPSPIKPPEGCKFHTRCYMACDKCKRVPPPYVEVEPGHFVACHFLDKKVDENGNYLFKVNTSTRNTRATAPTQE